MAALGFRDIIANISPTWLRTGVRERVMYTIGLTMDLLMEKLVEGMKMHMPGYGDPSALPFIGDDRQIQRGLADTDDTYALRLKRALDTWRYAGNARAVLGQALAFVGVAPAIRSVMNNAYWDQSNWDYFLDSADPASAPTHLAVKPHNWDWDSISDPDVYARWWRRWLIIPFNNNNTSATWIGPCPAWGGGVKWGDTTRSWGFDKPSSYADLLRLLVNEWKSAGTFYPWIIVSFADALFQPTDPPGAGTLPDGNWGRWSKTTVGADGMPRRVRSRDSSARYINGVT